MNEQSHDAPRPLARRIASIPTSDGARFWLRRRIGPVRGLYLDPFLMLDGSSSDDAGDCIGGIPAHPHRGFETVSHMLDGRMLHEDRPGNKGKLNSGGAQWMSAGRGIIHSEIAQQEGGQMRMQMRGQIRSLQLWIKLPAVEKMKAGSLPRFPRRADCRAGNLA